MGETPLNSIMAELTELIEKADWKEVDPGIIADLSRRLTETSEAAHAALETGNEEPIRQPRLGEIVKNPITKSLTFAEAARLIGPEEINLETALQDAAKDQKEMPKEAYIELFKSGAKIDIEELGKVQTRLDAGEEVIVTFTIENGTPIIKFE
jgi:hypothetical protein